MHRKSWIAAALFLAPWTATRLMADDVTYEDVNGIRYQVTRQVVQRPVPETKYEPHTYNSYRERYTTDMQEQTRTYQTPVTSQQWVLGYQRSMNPFAPPTLAYKLVPVTQLQTHTETVRVPVTRRELVPETHTQHVPVTSYHIANEEHVHRVAVGVSGQGGALANSAPSNSSGGSFSASSTADSGPRDDSSDQISRRR
jgi:hypothetical protein